MPTYEFRCTACGHQFERFTPKISHESSAPCPECQGPAERLISGGAGFLFKGSGFYITDYRSDSYKQAAKKEEKPAGDGAGESKKDAKEKKSAKDTKSAKDKK